MQLRSGVGRGLLLTVLSIVLLLSVAMPVFAHDGEDDGHEEPAAAQVEETGGLTGEDTLIFLVGIGVVLVVGLAAVMRENFNMGE
ncbi:MAG: hypothetical protein D6712_07405 [Chloroflexi bacterium]|nr:MAG: hypothetical protein D6712_07405 [Chloroflexota bacterium]